MCLDLHVLGTGDDDDEGPVPPGVPLPFTFSIPGVSGDGRGGESQEWGEGSVLGTDSDESESLESGFGEASEDGVELSVAFEGDAALGGTSGDSTGGAGVVGTSPVYP